MLLDCAPGNDLLRTGIATMDDYQDELLEWHAAQQDCPDAGDDAQEL